MYTNLAKIAAEDDLSLQLAVQNSMLQGKYIGDLMDQIAQGRLTNAGARSIMKNIIDCKYEIGTSVSTMVDSALKELSRKAGREVLKF